MTTLPQSSCSSLLSHSAVSPLLETITLKCLYLKNRVKLKPSDEWSLVHTGMITCIKYPSRSDLIRLLNFILTCSLSFLYSFWLSPSLYWISLCSRSYWTRRERSWRHSLQPKSTLQFPHEQSSRRAEKIMVSHSWSRCLSSPNSHYFEMKRSPHAHLFRGVLKTEKSSIFTM